MAVDGFHRTTCFYLLHPLQGWPGFGRFTLIQTERVFHIGHNIFAFPKPIAWLID